MIRFELVEMLQEKDGSQTLCPGVAFSFKKVYRSGLLKSEHEYTIYYNRHTKKWRGDVIDSDGWHDIPKSELVNLIKEKKLEGMV